MTNATAREREIVRDALEGIALAISRSSDLDADSLEMTSKTKLEKYLYEGLKYRGDLGNVTHSWYLAGAKAAVSEELLDTNQLQSAFERVARGPKHSPQFSDEREGYTPTNRAREYADFYSHRYDLDEKWYTSGETFLLDFYRREAPEEYRELYTAVQRLRNVLSETDRELYRIAANEQQETTLAAFGQDATITGPDHYDEVTKLVSRIHIELANTDELAETLPAFRQFTDLVEDVFLALSELSVDRIESEQLQAFKSLKRFHFYEAWRLPALVISSQTAAGPRSEELQSEHLRTLDEQERRMREKLREQRQACAKAALVPTTADYSVSEDDVSSEIDELLRTYLE